MPETLEDAWHVAGKLELETQTQSSTSPWLLCPKKTPAGDQQEREENVAETKEENVLRQAGRALESATDWAIAAERSSQQTAAASASTAVPALSSTSKAHAKVASPSPVSAHDGENATDLPAQPFASLPPPPSTTAPNQTTPSSPSPWTETAEKKGPETREKAEPLGEADNSEAEKGSATATADASDASDASDAPDASDGWSILLLDMPGDGMVYVRSDHDPEESGLVRADGTLVLSFEISCPQDFRALEPAASRTILLDGLVQVNDMFQTIGPKDYICGPHMFHTLTLPDGFFLNPLSNGFLQPGLNTIAIWLDGVTSETHCTHTHTHTHTNTHTQV